MTTIDWLVNELERDDSKIARVIGLKKYNFIIRLAKEMEKNQIIDAYVNGDIDAGIYAATKKNAEQYYNETFNK
jgi:hypothetical protein